MTTSSATPNATPYAPRPGTLADRLLQHLRGQPVGTILTSSQISQLLNAEIKNLNNQLKTAVEHKLLDRVTVDLGRSSKQGYALAGMGPATGLATLPPAPAPTVRQTIRAQTAEAHAQAQAEAIGDFNAALWADGDLVLHGVQLNADETSITLNKHQVRLVRDLLRGVVLGDLPC